MLVRILTVVHNRARRQTAVARHTSHTTAEYPGISRLSLFPRDDCSCTVVSTLNTMHTPVNRRYIMVGIYDGCMIVSSILWLTCAKNHLVTRYGTLILYTSLNDPLLGLRRWHLRHHFIDTYLWHLDSHFVNQVLCYWHNPPM